MIVSGVFVMTAPADLDAVRATVNALPWADAYDATSDGRMIVTIEAADSDKAMEFLKELKQLPGVLSAEPVLHCFEDDAPAATPTDPEGLAALLNADDEPPPRRSYYSRLKAYGNH